MAAQVPAIEVPTDAELLQAQADLWRHTLYYLTSMGLRCAVKLGIPTAMHNLGGVTSLPDLAAVLSIPASKQPFLGRLMRALVTSGVFAAGGTNNSGRSSSASTHSPVSWWMVSMRKNTTARRPSCSPGRRRTTWKPRWGWPSGSRRTSPGRCHRCSRTCIARRSSTRAPRPWTQSSTRWSQMVWKPTTTWVSATIMRECHDLFKGLESLTDCCGGDGKTARAITKAHPHVKCTVLDLPKVIEKTPSDCVVNYVAGDLFHTVPRLRP
ncbi:O-methyltransferase ZRP4 [Hordeum vulgare]|nr:O-methyltransferase ZRP4 [Hordeum vulgare]